MINGPYLITLFFDSSMIDVLVLNDMVNDIRIIMSISADIDNYHDRHHIIKRMTNT